MKLQQIITSMLACSLIGASCSDDTISKDYRDNTSPLMSQELAEQIAQYNFIKVYAAQYTPTIKFGTILNADLYIGDEEYRQVANDNLQEITAADAMSHNIIVQNDGTLDFTKTDAFINNIPDGVSLFGYSLLDYTNQKQSYLKSLIGATTGDGTTIPTESNLIGNSDFESGSKNGWDIWGTGTGTISNNGEGYNGGYALQLSNSTVGNKWDAQAGYKFPSVLEKGATYTISFMAKASAANTSIQVQVQNSTNNGSQEAYKDFTLGTDYTTCQTEFTCSYEDVNRVVLNFGDVNGTFYIDNFIFMRKDNNNDNPGDEGGTTPIGENLVVNGNFEAGNTTGWVSWGSDETAKLTSDIDHGNVLTLKDTKATNTYSAKAAYNFTNTLQVGATYTIRLVIKADKACNIKFSFGDKDSSGEIGKDSYKDCNVTTSWQTITYTYTVTEKELKRFEINYGATQTTLYVDNISITTDNNIDSGNQEGSGGTSTTGNLISNGDFEAGNTTGWDVWGKQSNQLTQDETHGNVFMLACTEAGSSYTTCAGYNFANQLRAGTTYRLKMDIKADEACQIKIYFQNKTSPDKGEWYHDESVTTDWKSLNIQYTITGTTMDRIVIDFGRTATSYYIDNLSFTTSNNTAASIIPTRTATISIDTDKKKALVNAMDNWIKSMTEHIGERVTSCIVVNNPIGENGGIRGIDEFSGTDTAPTATSTGLSLNWDTSNGHFYWAYFLGKEYAVQAFQKARQYAPNAKLFISDYDLESSNAKLQAFINYIKYIDEQNGSPIIDGIGTQMHITCNIRKADIDDMFRKLVETGKLIRITELDVQVGTNLPNTTLQAAQANAYQMVVESYKENVPEAQQAGIMLGALSDNIKEHQIWLKKDAPNVFDIQFKRKHAYKGLCNGIAGKDISTTF